MTSQGREKCSLEEKKKKTVYSTFSMIPKDLLTLLGKDVTVLLMYIEKMVLTEKLQERGLDDGFMQKVHGSRYEP